jgi:hypothetical protein
MAMRSDCECRRNQPPPAVRIPAHIQNCTGAIGAHQGPVKILIILDHHGERGHIHPGP